jgi:hypothetical protein
MSALLFFWMSSVFSSMLSLITRRKTRVSFF